jgi:TRAP-type mannitol/chloroaromatic compound transport system permease small subunit
MNSFTRGFIRVVDAINYRIGRVAMYLLFVMMAILLWSSISKTFFTPSEWTLEMAQFAMVTYFILGGPYSMQGREDGHVRMDLFYGSWSPRTKAMVDGATVLFLVFFLVTLLYGALESAAYSLGYYGLKPFEFFWSLVTGFLTGGPDGAGRVMGTLERSSTAWRPVMWPIKLIICLGLILMLLQALAEFFRDLVRLRGGDA